MQDYSYLAHSKEKITPFQIERSIHNNWPPNLGAVKKPILFNNSSSMCIFKSLYIDIMPMDSLKFRWINIGFVPFSKLASVLYMKSEYLFSELVQCINITGKKMLFEFNCKPKDASVTKKYWSANNGIFGVIKINDSSYYVNIRMPNVEIINTIAQTNYYLSLRPSELCSLLDLGRTEWHNAIRVFPIDKFIKTANNGTLLDNSKIFAAIYERNEWRFAKIKNFKIKIGDALTRWMKPTYKEGYAILQDAGNPSDYLHKIHEFYTNFLLTNQRYKLTKLPLIHFNQSTKQTSQEFDGHVFNAPLNGKAVSYQFVKPNIQIYFYTDQKIKWLISDLKWEQLLHFCTCISDLSNIIGIFAEKLNAYNIRAKPLDK